MPRKSKPGSSYPPNWREIATAVKEAAGWRCVRCGAAHENRPGYTLTVHHLNLDPGDSAWFNLAALCCKCHLQIQHRVVIERPWVMEEHTPWFRPYAAGHYARKYLGLTLDRPTVERHMEWLLAIEVDVTLHGADLGDLRYEWAFRTV